MQCMATKLKSDSILLNMRSELLQNEQQIDQHGEDNYKVVKLHIVRDIFFGNNRADDPLFKKKDLRYDKYELSKIISFQQFELVMRPFKSDPIYRASLCMNKILIILICCMFLSVIAVLIFSQIEEEALMQIALWAYLISFIIAMIFSFYISCVIVKTKKALVEYCNKLDLSDNHMTISVVQKKVQKNIFKFTQLQAAEPGKYSLFFYEISHIQIKSTRILEEKNTVKLYCRGQIFNTFNTNIQQPLFKIIHFEFRKEGLEKIIPFEELEQLLRPFKKSEAFINMAIWNKRMMWGFLLILFMFTPLFLDVGEIFVMIFAVSTGVIVYIILMLILCRMIKAKKQAVAEFAGFCRKVSSQQERVKIIAHQYEEPLRGSKQQELYCLQIKQHND